MEQDDLKKLWDAAHAEPMGKELDAPELSRMLTRSSKSIIHRYLRVIQFECILGWIFLGVFGVLLFTLPQIRWFLIFALVLDVYLLVFFNSIFKRVKAISYNDSTREYFVRVLNVFKSFNRHYTILTYLVVPSVFLGGVLIYGKGTIILDHFTVPYFLFGLLLTWGIVKFWIGLLYGKKEKALEQLIRDMDRNGEESCESTGC